jgi:hypothetical protein
MTAQPEDKGSVISNANKKEPTARTRGLRKKQHNKVNKTTLMDASFEINNDTQNIILRGFRVGNRVVMHCPWCDRMHVHGWGQEDDHRVVEWRVAHHGSNPSFPDSYQISVFRPKDLKGIGYGPLQRGVSHGK